MRDNRRGLIVTMIHKFDGIPAGINTRENIYVLVDEAHRTTGGDLGNYLEASLPNATYIGFTGTPIDKTAHGSGTFKVFGRDDPGGYMDKYSISESIGDGATVPLHYTLAPNSLLVDRDTLDREFLDLPEVEGVDGAEDAANDMRGVMDKYPHWDDSGTHKRMIRQELYKVLIESGMRDPKRLNAIADKVMKTIVSNGR